MVNQFKPSKILKKEENKICISIGAFYSIFGFFALLMMKLQDLTISSFDDSPDDLFIKSKEALDEVWIIFMPLMILLGISYILFGILFKKIKSDKYMINLILSILSLIWVVAYGYSILFDSDSFFAIMGEMKILAYIFATFGFIVVLGLFTVPQYIIGKRIKKLETDNKKHIT